MYSYINKIKKYLILTLASMIIESFYKVCFLINFICRLVISQEVVKNVISLMHLSKTHWEIAKFWLPILICLFWFVYFFINKYFNSNCIMISVYKYL